MTERERIFKEVCHAMRRAEETDEYAILMADIAIEAMTRIKNFKPQKIKRLTLDEFRATGRNFKDILGGHQNTFGRIYEGNCIIKLMDDGRWLLIIGSEEWTDSNLAVLEERLYDDWYLREVF